MAFFSAPKPQGQLTLPQPLASLVVSCQALVFLDADSWLYVDGPWGIGVRRPERRPDLPGPISGEPFSNTTSLLEENPIRQEVIDHLGNNNGEFDWAPFFTHEARTAAEAQTLYAHPGDLGPPASSSLPPIGAQAPQFKIAPPPPRRAAPIPNTAIGLPTPEEEATLQDPIEAPRGLNVTAQRHFYDNPHRPPAGDPNLLSDGEFPPSIFRFNKVHNEGFDPVLLLQDDEPRDLDVDMDMNYSSKTPPRGDGRYAGGMDYQGALTRRLGFELEVTKRTQAPNTVLTLGHMNTQRTGMGAALGAARIPTSPLPLSGPRFAADLDPLPPFGTEAWSLDLFPASSFDEIAGLTVPTDSTRMLDPEENALNPKYCDELLEADFSKCGKVAVAQCVDRYVVFGVDFFPVACLSQKTRVVESSWFMPRKPLAIANSQMC